MESGRNESASVVVRAGLRALERDEQKYETKLAALRAAVDQGDASGFAGDGVFVRVREVFELPELPR